MLRDYITELSYGSVLPENITESYHGIVLPDYITESYYGLISRKHPYEIDPGEPQGVPGAPWDLWGPRRHALGTPL